MDFVYHIPEHWISSNKKKFTLSTKQLESIEQAPSGLECKKLQAYCFSNAKWGEVTIDKVLTTTPGNIHYLILTIKLLT